MPYLATAEAWLEQSTLLLEARPDARITTRYTITPGDATTKTKPPPGADPSVPRATLEVKAQDSAAGVALKYKTSKAQEVTRLFASMARIGRKQAGLPALSEDVVMDDAPERNVGTPIESGVATPVGDAPKVSTAGGKKKKKGKK